MIAAEWLSGTQLEQRVSLEDYSVSNRGLRTGLTGTPSEVQDRISDNKKLITCLHERSSDRIKDEAATIHIQIGS